jgi:hypothetical protein
MHAASLPVFTAKFRVSPTDSSLALSTGMLGIGLLIAGPLLLGSV